MENKANKRSKNRGAIIEKILEGIADLLIASKTSYYGNIYFALGKIIKILLEEKRLKKKQISRSMKILEKKKLIFIKKEKDKVYTHLSENGKKIVLQYSLKKILALKKKKKKWQGLWFIVFFDVPEEERVKRDYLRKFLKFIGFYHYQKSVYIYPFECKKEVDLIKKIIVGGRYLSYVVAKEIEDEEKYKRIFQLELGTYKKRSFRIST